jgi:hypothetical protein
MDFDAILNRITKAVNGFAGHVPETQRAMYREVLEAVQKLQVDKGKVKTSAANLSKLAGLKAKLMRLILTPEYKEAVKEYVKAFNEVTTLQNQYWKGVESNFKPPKLLAALREVSVEDVVGKLTEAGIGANIGDKITDILRQNITGGGSYADLTEQLRQSILTTPESAGTLDRYAKQITVDSLNQYNAQYTQVVTSDLGYEWFKYDKTDIEPTRPFCDAMTDIKYFHISEVPAILRGEGLTYVDKKGDRVQVKLYSKTGLPHGMIPGTDASNFFVRRGGYNCGHQIRPVNGGQVPDEIKARVLSTPAYVRWAAANQQTPVAPPKEAKPVPQPPKPAPTVKRQPLRKPKESFVAQELKKRNADVLSKLRSANIDTAEDLLQYLPQANIEIRYDPAATGSHFHPQLKYLTINSAGRANSTYWRKKIMAHEMAHAIHNENEIITRLKVREDFATMFKGLRKQLKDDTASDIGYELIKANRQAALKGDSDGVEQVTTVADILGSLTMGKHGWGHQKVYYKRFYGAEKEIFAHAVQLLKLDNKYTNIHPAMKEIVRQMKEYASKTLQAIKEQS